ncbi:hypothetical protein ACV229_40220 [Burkholderia sp. MR1-5-21]
MEITQGGGSGACPVLAPVVGFSVSQGGGVNVSFSRSDSVRGNYAGENEQA